MEENTKYLTNDFLKNLYESIQPKEDLLNCPIEKMDEVQQRGVQLLKKVLCIEELQKMFDREPEFEKEDTFSSMGVEIDKYELNAIKGLPMAVYHVKPAVSNGKTILYLHGHDDLGIMGALLERYDKERYHKMIPLLMAKEGYDVVAPECIGFGDARFYDFPVGTEKYNGCFVNSAYLSLAGFNIAGFRVYQAIKALDMIPKLGLSDRITAFGISGGGISCQQISVLDDRIKNVLAASSCNTFMNSTLSKEHCVDNYTQGLMTVGDSYKILALAAPKPLYTVSGTWDRAFPEAGSKIAFEYLDKVYARRNASDNYKHEIFEGKHEIKAELILGWLKEFA